MDGNAIYYEIGMDDYCIWMLDLIVIVKKFLMKTNQGNWIFHFFSPESDPTKKKKGKNEALGSNS